MSTLARHLGEYDGRIPVEPRSAQFLPAHELEDCWQALPGGPEALCEQSGEVWQYMGTYRILGGSERVHEFRHRCYGAGHARQLAQVMEDRA